MDLVLPSAFVAWTEREAATLTALVEDLTELALSSRMPPVNRDERIVSDIDSRDIIGETSVSHKDLAGQLTARFYEKDGRFLGLADDKLITVLKFSEKISSRKELRDILSDETVREIVLDWIGDTVRNRPTETISEKLKRIVREKVQSLTIWISVEETEVEGEVRFADAILKMASRRELDALIENGFENAPAETVRLRKEKFHRTWLGRATIRFSLNAEPRRAQELALEKAQDYMALLQFYGQAPLVFPLVSYAAPSGTRSRGTIRSIAVQNERFIYASAGLAGATNDLHLGDVYYREMEKAGFSALSDLALHRKSEYENDLFNSLLVYGRACYQIDPIDKLLQIMTSVEMFLLKDSAEQIMTSVADRIAFAVANDVASRLSIVENFKEVYAIRSKRTHHGRTIDEAKSIEIFLYNIQMFFIVAIKSIGRFDTRADFLKHVNDVKYS